MKDIIEMLKSNPYPGRGILLGRAENGNTRLIYFIMGRSENSRNRIFEYTDDGIRTQAYDPAKLKDPSLIIYNPVRLYNGRVIVTNGDQTDTVRAFLEQGKTFREALMTREFEPDAPNYTPRISGIAAEDGGIELSIIKSMDGSADCCCRYFYNYDRPIPGTGYFISTYMGDGDILPSYEGEPVYSAIPDEEAVWTALNSDNKVSLYCCELDITGNIISQRIINKFSKQPDGKIVI
jgi:IMP cyclohydrolase